MGWPGENLIIKMWSSLVDRGIGNLLTPWQKRREGQADTEVQAKRIVYLAHAEQLAKDFQEGKKTLDANGNVIDMPRLIPPSPKSDQVESPPTQPLLVVQQQAAARELKQEINVSAAILHAEQALRDDPQAAPTENIDPDWISRWRENAAEVSTEELQLLWGRVLAGEVKQPGTFSLRTLEFLRNLSTAEATNVALLLRFAIADFIYMSKEIEVLLEKHGITFNVLLQLQDLGVLNPGPRLGVTTKLGSAKPDTYIRYIKAHNKVLIVRHTDPTQELRVPIYRLTVIGHELTKLGQFTTVDEYLTIVAKAIKEHQFTVHVADIVGQHGDGLLLGPESPL